MKRIRTWEVTYGEIIRATCKKLGNVKPEELMAIINKLSSWKKVEELGAKNNLLLVKANKLKNELKEQKDEAQIVLDKLNKVLLVNQKLEEYVGNPSDVFNKAGFFDHNLASHLVLGTKVIPILVDFATKMEELLDNLRSLFNRLAPETTEDVALEHILDISMETKEISSFTRCGGEGAQMQSPTKLQHPECSQPAKDIEECGSEHKPERQPALQGSRVEEGTREIDVENINLTTKEVELSQNRPNQMSRSDTPQQETARIDLMQIEVDERPTKRIQEVAIGPDVENVEPIRMEIP